MFECQAGERCMGWGGGVLTSSPPHGPGGKPAGNGPRKGALATLAGSAALARPAAARSGYAAAQREGL